MYKIFLIFFILKAVLSVSDNESFEKYIDLLPEKEKQEFLDRIARRLLDGIKTEDIPNQSHADIDDDQLETHDSIVQNIMKEETDKLKEEKNQDNLELSNKNDNKPEESHIDLTLREGRRLKRKDDSDIIETTSEFDYNVILVKPIKKDGDKKEYSIESKQDTNVLPITQNTGNAKSFENNLTNPSSLINKNNHKQLETSDSNIKQTEQYKLTTDVYKSNNHSSKANFNETTIDVMTTSDDYDEHNLTIKNTLPTEKENMTTETSILLYENKRELINNNSKLNTSNEHGTENSTGVDTTESDIIITTESQLSEKLNNSVKDAPSLKITENKESSTHRNINILSIKKHVTDVNVKNNGFVAKNTINSKTALRLGPDSVTHRKQKEYEVYEIAPEKSAFSIKKNTKDIEQKHYVPVYNYAPENAYFRPFDRFGPDNYNVRHEIIENYESDRELDELNREPDLEVDASITLNVPNTRSRFAGYNKKQYRPFRINNNLNIKEKSGYNFIKPVHKMHHNIFYNPNDYIDMDYPYRTQRKNQRFPDSNEPDHLYNKMHKSNTLKDHIRGVRQLLYLQNKFGYVPHVNDKVRKFNKKPQIKKDMRLLKEPINNDIAVDYYFGRIKSNENYEVLKANKKVKQILEKNVDTELKVIDEKKFHHFFYNMLQVLEDMIRFDNGALEKYAWLITTVDIRTAVRKLIDLSEALLYDDNLHVKDVELLKYCIYLFKSSKNILHHIQSNRKPNFRVTPIKNKKHKGLLPHNRHRVDKIKQPLKFWKDFSKFIRNEREIKSSKLTMLYDFENFLQSILFHLNEFHDAIKHIAMITKHGNQMWFRDLRKIYLNGANKRQLAEVVLHISLVDLLESIEEDAVNGLEDNFKGFVKNNLNAVERTRDKFIFLMHVLKEINRV